MSPGLRPTSVPSAILIHPPLGCNRHGPKSEGCCAPFRGGSWVPSNRMSNGLRPTSVDSGILMHPIV